MVGALLLTENDPKQNASRGGAIEGENALTPNEQTRIAVEGKLDTRIQGQGKVGIGQAQAQATAKVGLMPRRSRSNWPKSGLKSSVPPIRKVGP